MLEKVVLLVVGAAVGGIGTLILRWLRKDRITEEIGRRADTAKLIATMRELGVSEAQIDNALVWIEPRNRQRAPLSLEEQLERQEYAEIARAQSQHELNQAQGRRLVRLEGRMASALEDLKGRLDADMQKRLMESQAAWEEYQDRMTEFAGAPWETGSMRPFIEAGIRSRLTKQRAADLEDELATWGEGGA